MIEKDNIEYYLIGTKNGVEDFIRVNGCEFQTDYNEAKKIKSILEDKKEFHSIRIVKLDFVNYDMKKDFINTINKKHIL